MTSEDKQIQQTIELMSGMCRALTALSSEVLPVNPQRFAMLADSPLEDLRRLSEELNCYIEEKLAPFQENETSEDERVHAA